MIYILKEQHKEGTGRNAGTKARADVETIVASEYGEIIDLEMKEESEGPKKYVERKHALLNSLESVHFKKDDIFLIQFPFLRDSLLYLPVLKKLKKQGVKIVILIHDVDLLRNYIFEKKWNKAFVREFLNEHCFFKMADNVISHNPKMSIFLKKIGISESKLVNLGIFDYLSDFQPVQHEFNGDYRVAIAGNLTVIKAGYLYDLPESVHFNLYGIGVNQEKMTKNSVYFGSFAPDELVSKIEGNFGLVWDGKSTEGCTGNFGLYLQYNNPHKASLYLASNLPLIVWSKSALAGFVQENKCGIAVDSLYQLEEIFASLSKEEYEQMKMNAEKIGARVRQGQYFKDALAKC
jgi:hypothetical protein